MNTNANKNQTKRLVLAAMSAALICIATMLFPIPIPATSGYVNLGDGFIFIAAALLGPLYGCLAGGIGSMLADILSGYAYYAPATLIIKGLAGFVFALVFSKFSQKHAQVKICFSIIISALAGSLVISGGYFLYECILYGVKAAALSVPFNLLQNTVGLVLATILFPFVKKIFREI